MALCRVELYVLPKQKKKKSFIFESNIIMWFFLLLSFFFHSIVTLQSCLDYLQFSAFFHTYHSIPFLFSLHLLYLFLYFGECFPQYSLKCGCLNLLKIKLAVFSTQLEQNNCDC